VFETSVRFLRAVLALPGVAVSVISRDPAAAFPEDIRAHADAYEQVADPLDARQLVAAVQRLAQRYPRADRLLGVLEQLQEPLAQARELLGLPGMSPEAATNFRNKSVMKDRLRAAGLPCAQSLLGTSVAEVVEAVSRIGLPVVVKPPDGAGAIGTFRIDDAGQLKQAMAALRPSPARPVLVEQFLTGREHSYDSICINGQVLWSSVSDYEPTPLTVLENPWVQWCVLLPRSIETPEYDDIRRIGPAALTALGMDTGLAHMEWFQLPDGSVAVSEVGARPPGAQFVSLMSWAHDTDMYAVWARLVVLDDFEPPARPYAAGAAYFRGQGQGRVKAVHGLDIAQRELGELVVESSLPSRGKRAGSSYEGDGYAILRHPDTEVVRQGLQRLVSLIRVELDGSP
jgi:hypothetical protein